MGCTNSKNLDVKAGNTIDKKNTENTPNIIEDKTASKDNDMTKNGFGDEEDDHEG